MEGTARTRHEESGGRPWGRKLPERERLERGPAVSKTSVKRVASFTSSTGCQTQPFGIRKRRHTNSHDVRRDALSELRRLCLET